MFSSIEKRYNPEYDVPDGPPVTWAEKDLYDEVVALQERVRVLEENQPKLTSIVAPSDTKEEDQKYWRKRCAGLDPTSNIVIIIPTIPSR